MSAPSRIIVQSDWDQSLRTINGKAWLTVKKTGSPSIYGEIVTTQLSEECGSPYVRASENFAVPAISKKSLTVTYTDPESDINCVTCHFRAPNVTFSTIHTHGKSVLGLDVTEGGLAVSSDTAGKLLLWQTNNGEIRRELIGHVGDVYTCRFFPSGVVIVSAGADTQLKIWSAETGQCAATIVGHKAGVNEVNIIDRGRNILSCSNDGTVKLWDCGQQKCLGTIEPNTGVLNCCAVQKVYSDVTLSGTRENIDEREIGTAGKMLLTGGEGKLLKAYGLQSRESVFELQCHDAVNCVTFLSDVTAVCGTQSGHIVVIDIRNPSVPLKEYKDTRSAILSVLTHKQGFLASTGVNEVNIIDRGRNILSCSNDGTVKLWDCGQQKCLGTIEPNTGVLNCCAVQKVYSDVTLGGTRENIDEREVGTAGKMLLTGGEGKLLKAYGLQSRESVFELQCHDAVNCVTFLSDVTAVCGTQSGHIVVIDIRNPSVPLKEYKDTRSAILSVLTHTQGFLASTGDGSCFYMDESYTSTLDLTGPDCDPVYRVVQDRDNIYTACRDGSIRKYKLDS
ncbi:unnamed protein product [Owenia fusiformis]|uniref:Proteasomal ATPase-associated factor 1 n=1 Tax=Owenia fusiformis TaxID=6347 RepID=A0A8S4Q4P5_OWEFU|nr:unnamed protein product [Owenia fusiformis]